MFAFTRGKTVQKRYGNGTESNGRYGMRYDSCVRLERSIIESLYDRSTKTERQLFFVHYCNWQNLLPQQSLSWCLHKLLCY